jgi:hypothetical protein
MKKLSIALSLVGFIIQYIFPILLFGTVAPYTHGALRKGLTVVGYCVIGVVVFIVSKKLKEWILAKPKSLWRGIILSIFPVVWWLLIFLCLGWLSTFMLTLARYWNKIIIFIIVGRCFYIASESVANITTEEGVSQ